MDIDRKSLNLLSMNRAMTEKQLIEELRCGNESAFRRIYDRHYVPLCRFADLFLHDASLSEEVVDDAIFYLWEHRSEVEITYSLKAYLMKSVRNRCLNELNSLAHREELQFSLKSASNLNGNLNCSKELEHYAS